MPELPEVETVRRGLMPALLGRSLSRVVVRRADLRFPLPHDFGRRIEGQRVLGIDRRGKYLLISLTGDWVWLVHLGMSGSFRFGADAGRLTHDHLVIGTDAGTEIAFHDPRRFGFMDLAAADAIDRHPRLVGLGVDPLSAGFTPAYLRSRLAGRRSALKTALMDQAVVAGMGNIYASESLFRARLSPAREAGNVPARGLARLTAAIGAVFAEAIAAGGSSLKDHVQPSGELGCFQHSFAVYDRAGQPCPSCSCDVDATGGIQRIVLGGRATYYCPRRQL
ncbi:MAG TPA: bifunctional DNA-formamidopyrimidine glycosylase/DNA-(apurinic or apyrimidinic site) lyase [Defluviicoccus sp.]|nr:bifunctional DNA-formamidopyrimidine glycosylase/DNA-(apurinic or apyrimidinic site) lyase [Defluviicoccus sp.]